MSCRQVVVLSLASTARGRFINCANHQHRRLYDASRRDSSPNPPARPVGHTTVGLQCMCPAHPSPPKPLTYFSLLQIGTWRDLSGHATWSYIYYTPYDNESKREDGGF